MAPFLTDPNLAVLQTAIQLLNEIIDRQSYEDDSIFAVENFFHNSIPEAKSEVLLAALNLLIKVT
jgi:hypothetical protein